MPDRHDLVLVSNRLPVDFTPDDTGAPGWSTSPGGLVAALQPIAQAANGVWVGWPGVADLALDPFVHEGVQLVPVSLTSTEIADYYEGFANATLWPLCHDLIAAPVFRREWWHTYSEVNRRFAEASAELAAPGATVWVHDYHLMLVPRMLRELRPDLRIGYFHHIPFPELGIFSQLPWRRQVLEGLLGCDVVGFQRGSDARNVLRAVRRLLHLPTQGALIEVPAGDGRRNVLARSVPISIDVDEFARLAQDPAVIARATAIRAELGQPTRLLLGVDRLDYTKGIGHRLAAFGELLAEHRLAAGECVLVQVASPSRECVDSYRQLRDEIELAVGRINGDQSTLGHQPVVYLHQHIDRAELVALYFAADVLLVTALRDGMNLIAKEYVASRSGVDGVLVLSEFAGAGDELRQAIKVNPHDLDALKQAIVDAVEMPRVEQTRRMRALRRTVRQHDVRHWADTFLGAVQARALRPGFDAISPSLGSALRTLVRAPRVLIALDFDGTLAGFHVDPDQVQMNARSRTAITRLSALTETPIALISGRGLENLRRAARVPTDVLLSGSHGAEGWLGSGESAAELSDTEASGLDALVELLEAEAAAHAGAWVEPKPVGAVFHVRRMSRAAAAAALTAARDRVGATFPHLVARSGRAIVEFSLRADTKGTAIDRLRDAIGGARVLFIGDDVSDEDGFAALRRGDVGVKVGDGPTLARHRVATIDDVASVLDLVAAERARLVSAKLDS
ncbi:MAG TPA: bifunctional alpha,alpha-trehalose-phosphate synthase (UDP-forming)/trehalose-phosphatase [Candidatus Lumbricidophila sp.]|nr:bifunctional alpha,alpha-trehalose-phosphate synthase (UDP-forming)/trehalose-phosphatase [Candidatus Lumbricidophila sp.]